MGFCKNFFSHFIFPALCLVMGCLFCSAKFLSNLADTPDYRNSCLAAVSKPEIFAQFKRCGLYTLLQEYTTFEEGKLYAAYTVEHYPELLRHIESFRKNDTLGSPRLFSYGFFGEMAPSTVRYIKIAGDIEHHLGSWQDKHVVEIGGGYGGLCTILSSLHVWKSYTIVDLPENLALAQIYLEKMGVLGVRFLTPDQLSRSDTFDMVLSDHFFGQCHRSYQEKLLKSIFYKTSSGYILCGSYPRHFRIKPFSKQELVHKCNKNKLHTFCFPETPEVAKDNFILTWK